MEIPDAAISITYDHLDDHITIASELKAIRPCGLCGAEVHDDDSAQHWRTHRAAAIAAR